MRNVTTVRGPTQIKIDQAKLLRQLNDLEVTNDKLSKEISLAMQYVDKVNLEKSTLEKELVEVKTKLQMTQTNLERTTKRLESLREKNKEDNIVRQKALDEYHTHDNKGVKP